ncbi:MAG: hypothetical protein FP825_18425 [Hyphomonas sp.]|uniref:hypothetical protein n=1 Tax=Hyphomonas sp. TaxID=87 RepID=UPI00180146BE|nr:hypothetical protein [Hyphomonas sp.]MBA3070440.1 hypothetical protein [Hyphomonas sp.]MBU3921347.1 hypothetical protein [Alphaproteobacteria bacterium]MBU4061754.1 hypothetical protein [Alphaproteobacteria bacterium]MBU4164562.1 hypothetical protein [Alphaproteobacteria bacterium]
MRFLIVSAAALTALSGCGGLGRPSDKQALVATCIEKGEAEATCNCVADALEKNLKPELFKKVAQAAGRDKQDMVEFMSSLPVEDLLAFSAVTNDLEACGGAAPAGE